MVPFLFKRSGLKPPPPPQAENHDYAAEVVHIKSLSTWNSILEAARLRNYERILIISKNVIEGTFPTIQYHKACKTRFTLKRDVGTLKQEQGKRAEEIKQRDTTTAAKRRLY